MTGAPPDHVELWDDGLPIAVAARGGLGVPRVDDPGALPLDVFLDGARVEQCIGFDRRRGLIWRYAMNGDKYVIRDNELVIERVPGVVAVKERAR